MLLRRLAAILLVAAPAGAEQAFVLSTDFETAYYSRLALTAPYGRDVDLGPTCADAVVRAHGDRVYVVGRLGCDFVQTIDAATGTTLGQWSTGNGTNPHDIEIYTSSQAYVSLYERDFILVVDPRNGSALGQVSLSVFSDADGLPEADEMVRVGDRLFVALERLDRPGGYVAANPSVLAVIDCVTNQLVDVDPSTAGIQGVPLAGRNPTGELLFDPVRQKIVVACVGNYGAQDGGAEYVDPWTLQSDGFFVSESTLGGDLTAVRLWDDCTGYALVSDASFNTKLVRFDHCNGSSLGACLTTPGFRLSDVEIHAGGTVLVTDRDLIAPGVRLFSAPGCSEITSAPLDFGLPPYDLALARPQTLAAAPVGLPGDALRLLPNRPNPFHPRTTLSFVAPVGSHVVLDIVDVRGRRLATLWNGVTSAMETRVVWDGRGLPAGQYVATLRGNGTRRTQQLVLLR